MVKTTPENPFRPESLYCLAITKIYNPERTRRDYWWNSGGTTYYTNSDIPDSP